MKWLERLLTKMGIIKNNIEDFGDFTEYSKRMEQAKKIWLSLYKNEPKYIDENSMNGTITREMETLNMGKVVSEELTSLIFSEDTKIDISDEHVNEYINKVMKDNKFNRNFSQLLETMFATGSAVIKVYIEDGNIKLSYVRSDSYNVLEAINGNITNIVFYNDFYIKQKKYRHLEYHKRFKDGSYQVKNKLYNVNGGVYIPVSLSILDDELEEEINFQNLETNLFIYFKTNLANNIDFNSYEGISIYANSIPTINSIDNAYDSMINEIKLGRKRIFVPTSMLKPVVDTKTGEMRQYFDTSDSVYEGYNSIGIEGQDGIKESNPTLRIDEHVKAINTHLEILSMQTGFSSGTFTMSEKGLKTATEIVSENSKTYKTKQKQQVTIEESLRELVYTIIVLSEEMGITELDCMCDNKEDYNLTVKFNNAIVKDESSEIDKQIRMVDAKFQSKKRAIMEIQKVTEEEAKRILEEIVNEDMSKGLIDRMDIMKRPK